MVSLPKQKVGKKSRREYFDKRHDVNTTSDFGFCQPTLCEYIPADSSIKLKQSSFVRLAPLPCPTFGRIQVKNFTRFVDIHEVFEAFDYQQSQKTVQSALRAYVPQKADVVNNYSLLGYLLTMSMYASKGAPSYDWVRQMFRMSVWSNECLYVDEEFQAQASASTDSYNYTGYKWKDIINDSEMISNPYRQVTGYEILNKLCTGSTPDSFIDSPLFKALKSLFNLPGLVFPSVGSGGTIDTVDWTPSLRFFATDDPNRSYDAQTSIRTSGHWPNSTFGYNSGLGSIMEISRNDTLYYPTSNMFSAVPSWFAGEYKQAMSLENADFLFPLELAAPINYSVYADDDGDVWKTGSVSKFVIGLHLTSYGRRIMKILTGCGYTFRYNEDKSFLPLLSYYKAWFDEYNAGRDFQWRDTPAFKLIHSFYDTGTSTQSYLDDSASITGVSNEELRMTFFSFLADLPRCVYCQRIDNVTVATSTPLLEVEANESSINSVGIYNDNGNTDLYLSQSLGRNNIYGDVNANGDFSASGGLGIKLLERLYHFMNKNSLIGARVDKYMQVHFGFGLPESPVLGRTEFMCDVSDVMSTVQNSESFLGEYAGKGIGADAGKGMTYEAKHNGYLISMMCIVPIGGYVQGDKTEPVERFDFYESMYDSLGMQPLTMGNVFGRSSVLRKSPQQTFGFVPRYFPLKVKNNLANGGFSLRSQRTQFMPYSLDRIFTEEDFVLDESGANLENVLPVDLAADESLRYIGVTEQYGNFDRIFYDTTGRSDNFIVHMINEFEQWSPMKPVSESYDTFDKDTDDAITNIAHS